VSAEHFQTFLSCDMRTALNGRDVEYAESNTQEPRSFVLGADCRLAFNPEVENRGRAWSSCYLHTHSAVEVCAQTVERDVMTGLTGDHPEKRKQAASLLRAVGHAVRELALDAAFDGSMDDDRWEAALQRVREAAAPLALTDEVPA